MTTTAQVTRALRKAGRATTTSAKLADRNGADWVIGGRDAPYIVVNAAMDSPWETGEAYDDFVARGDATAAKVAGILFDAGLVVYSSIQWYTDISGAPFRQRSVCQICVLA